MSWMERHGSDCPSGKVQYTSEGAVAMVMASRGFRPYECPEARCGLWHFTTRPDGRVETTTREGAAA